MLEALSRLETARDVALRIAKSASALYLWLHDLLQRARRKCRLRGILDEIILRSGFIVYLPGLADGAQRRQNVARLLAGATEFDNQKNGGLTEYLENVALVSDADAVTTAKTRRVSADDAAYTPRASNTRIGFHRGNGGRGCSRISDPTRTTAKISRKNGAFVMWSMTRARQLLYLTNTLSRELYGQRNEPRPSRFLAEIKQDLLRRIAPEEPPPRVPFVRECLSLMSATWTIASHSYPRRSWRRGGLGVGTPGDASYVRARRHPQAGRSR